MNSYIVTPIEINAPYTQSDSDFIKKLIAQNFLKLEESLTELSEMNNRLNSSP